MSCSIWGSSSLQRDQTQPNLVAAREKLFNFQRYGLKEHLRRTIVSLIVSFILVLVLVTVIVNINNTAMEHRYIFEVEKSKMDVICILQRP